MPDVAANALSIAFGNFRAGYLIAERIGDADPARSVHQQAVRPFLRDQAGRRAGDEFGGDQAAEVRAPDERRSAGRVTPACRSPRRERQFSVRTPSRPSMRTRLPRRTENHDRGRAAGPAAGGGGGGEGVPAESSTPTRTRCSPAWRAARRSMCEAFTGRALIDRAVAEMLAASAAPGPGSARRRCGRSRGSRRSPRRRGAARWRRRPMRSTSTPAGDGWVRLLDAGEREARLRVAYGPGMAAEPDGLPEALRHGIVRLAAHLYTQRGRRPSGAGPPAAVTALWRPVAAAPAADRTEIMFETTGSARGARGGAAARRQRRRRSRSDARGAAARRRGRGGSRTACGFRAAALGRRLALDAACAGRSRGRRR